MTEIDRLIVHFDRGLRTLFAPGRSLRPMPGDDLPEAALAPDEKRHVGALMRVNHTGEVCAQALYQGQALTARSGDVRKTLEQAAFEEGEHLAWTERRIDELGGRKSFLNPFWYASSFTIGAVAGMLGDKWNLGFLAETERQVGKHLDGHLQRLPTQDVKSRLVLEQMQKDEAQHASNALFYGGAALPLAVRLAMRLSSKVMTTGAYWV